MRYGRLGILSLNSERIPPFTPLTRAEPSFAHQNTSRSGDGRESRHSTTKSGSVKARILKNIGQTSSSASTRPGQMLTSQKSTRCRTFELSGTAMSGNCTSSAKSNSKPSTPQATKWQALTLESRTSPQSRSPTNTSCIPATHSSKTNTTSSEPSKTLRVRMAPRRSRCGHVENSLTARRTFTTR